MSPLDELRARSANMARHRDVHTEEIVRLIRTLQEQRIGRFRVTTQSPYGFGPVTGFICGLRRHSYQVKVDKGHTTFLMAPMSDEPDHQVVPHAEWFAAFLTDLDGWSGPA